VHKPEHVTDSSTVCLLNEIPSLFRLTNSDLLIVDYNPKTPKELIKI